MALLSSSLTAGAVSGAYLSPPFFVSVVALFASLFSLIFVFIFYGRRPAPALLSLALASFFLGAGLAGISMERASKITVPLGKEEYFFCEAVLVSGQTPTKWGSRADVKLLACGEDRSLKKAQGGVRLYLPHGAGPFQEGGRIRFSARFSSPRDFLNEGVFSYSGHLLVHGISAMGYARGRVEPLRNDAGALSRYISRARSKLSDSVITALSKGDRGVVLALAAGERGAIPQNVLDAFSVTGITHILSISGLHVGFIAIIIYVLSKYVFGLFPSLILRIPLQRLAAQFTLPSVWAYVLLTGSAVSAVRAAIMCTVFLTGVIAGRRQDLLTSLAVAVALIIFYTPLAVFDISFQLSVLAVAGIIVIYPPVEKLLRKRLPDTFFGRASRWLLSLVAVSASASVVTAPLIAYHFKIFTPLGLVFNIIAVPLSAVIVLVIAFASVGAFISPEFVFPVWKIAGILSNALTGFAVAGAGLCRPAVFHLAPDVFETAFMSLCIGAVVFWRRLHYRWAVLVVLSVVFTVGAFRAWFVPMLNDEMKIVFLDVGQGDSTLILFPNGKRILVDGGGIKGSDFDVGKNVIAPALWRMGIHHIDWLVLTHPHHDHYMGLSYIAEEFSPQLIWTNGLSAPEDEAGGWMEFLKRTGDANVPLVDVDAKGVVLQEGGADFSLVKLHGTDGLQLNDTTLAAFLNYGKIRALLMGDLSMEGEAMLLKSCPDIRSNVLKVGHHGSRDASGAEFLSAVSPSVAVISVGRGNKYGMPDDEALERLEAAGAKIYRTDLHGAVTVKMNGERADVVTYVPSPL